MNLAKRKRGAKNTLVSCSRRKKQENNVSYLNKEIIFDILSYLPAVFLHNKGRSVCKLWADIVRDPKFITTHLYHSVPGLFIQCTERSRPLFLEIEKAELKLTKLKPCVLGRMLASCDGVSLFVNTAPRQALYVGNIITMKAVKLPCPSATHEILFQCSGIARIPHTGEFRVICPGLDMNRQCDWFIAKVGSDISWKKIGSTIQYGITHSFSIWEPICCGSIVHYTGYDFSNHCDYILAINLCDETIYEVLVPSKTFCPYLHFLSMENHLCSIGGEELHSKFHVWILKDSFRSEWIKLYDIEVDFKHEERFFRPYAWLDNNQILVFIIPMWGSSKHEIVAYNVKTGERKTIKNFNGYLCVLKGHTNSLVSW